MERLVESDESSFCTHAAGKQRKRRWVLRTLRSIGAGRPVSGEMRKARQYPLGRLTGSRWHSRFRSHTIVICCFLLSPSPSSSFSSYSTSCCCCGGQLSSFHVCPGNSSPPQSWLIDKLWDGRSSFFFFFAEKVCKRQFGIKRLKCIWNRLRRSHANKEKRNLQKQLDRRSRAGKWNYRKGREADCRLTFCPTWSRRWTASVCLCCFLLSISSSFFFFFFFFFLLLFVTGVVGDVSLIGLRSSVEKRRRRKIEREESDWQSGGRLNVENIDEKKGPRWTCRQAEAIGAITTQSKSISAGKSSFSSRKTLAPAISIFHFISSFFPAFRPHQFHFTSYNYYNCYSLLRHPKEMYNKWS